MGSCNSVCFKPHKFHNTHYQNRSSTLTSSTGTHSQKHIAQQLRKNVPHLDDNKCLAWAEVLNYLQKQVKKHCVQTGLIGFEVMKIVLERFRKYHLTIVDKRIFFDITNQMITYNYSPKRQIQSTYICSDLGLRFKQLQQRLLQNHKSSLQHFKFITGQHHQKKHYHSARFRQLQFTLSKKQLQNLTGIVRTFCQENLNAFAILSLYFRVFFEKNIGKMTLKQLENAYLDGLKVLIEDYAAVDVDQKLLETTKMKIQQISVLDQQQELLIFEKCIGTNLQQFIEFINEKQTISCKDVKTFEDLLENLAVSCISTTKIQFRLKTHSGSIAQLLCDYVIDSELKENVMEWSQKFRQQHCRNKKDQVDSLQQLAENEVDYVQKSIEQYLSQQQLIKIKSLPIFKAELEFLSLPKLIEATNKLILLCNTFAYPITTTTDCLSQIQKNYVLIIKLPHTCAQVTLQLRQYSISNQFNLKLRQLLKPKLFSPTTNLILLNKKWDRQFFTEMFLTIESISHHTRRNCHSHNQLRTSQDLGFQDMGFELTQFARQYLLPYRIDVGDFDERTKTQIVQIFSKIQQMGQPVNKYPQHIRQSYKPIDQKINQISLLVSMGQIDSAFQIFQTVKLAQLQPRRQGLETCADLWVQKGQLEQSLQAYQKCLMLYRKDQTQSYLRVLEKQSAAYALMGNYPQSLDKYHQSLNIRQLVFSDNPSFDPSFALIKMGDVYSAQQHYKIGITCFEQALKIRAVLLGQFSAEYAETLGRIGSAYQARRQHDKALDYNKKCLKISEIVHGRQSMASSKLMDQLGSSCLFRANYEQALAYYEKSLKICERVNGKDTLACVPSLSNIGSVYLKCCEYKQCLPYFKKCLSIVEHTFGKTAIQCVKPLNKLIVVFYHMERFQDAVVCGVRCLEIQGKAKGMQSVDCSGTLFGLSIGYEKLGMGKEARDVCQRAYDIRLKELGAEHQLTVETRERLKDLQSASMSVFC